MGGTSAPTAMSSSAFKSERIENEEQLATAVADVARNPVRAGICVDEADWRWSSHGSSRCVHRHSVMATVPTCGERSEG